MIAIRNEYACEEGVSKNAKNEDSKPRGHEVGRMLYNMDYGVLSQIRCRNKCERLNAASYNWRDQSIVDTAGRINGCRCYSHKATEKLELIRNDEEDWLFCRKQGKLDHNVNNTNECFR